METGQIPNHLKSVPTHKHIIPKTSINSYAFYFIFLLVGVAFDLAFKVNLVDDAAILPLGIALLFFGTVMIFWAQISAVNLNEKEVTKENFSKGPYRFTSHPTHWGLFLLIIGYGIVFNSFFVIAFTILSHLLAKVFFIKKHESAMCDHFGVSYKEYKDSVRF